MRRDLGQPRSRRERLLKPRDVADLYDVCVRTVVGWAASGRLPYIRTPGGQYRFRPADVDDLLSVIGDESYDLPQNTNEPAGALTPTGP